MQNNSVQNQNQPAQKNKKAGGKVIKVHSKQKQDLNCIVTRKTSKHEQKPFPLFPQNKINNFSTNPKDATIP